MEMTADQLIYHSFPGRTRVLVALKHELSLTCLSIPELDATVLAARDDPVSIRGHGNGKDIVLHVSNPAQEGSLTL